MKLPLHSFRNAIIDADGWAVAHVATGNLPLAVICERAESLANTANMLPDLVAALRELHLCASNPWTEEQSIRKMKAFLMAEELLTSAALATGGK